jgi:hypothetical protein
MLLRLKTNEELLNTPGVRYNTWAYIGPNAVLTLDMIHKYGTKVLQLTSLQEEAYTTTGACSFDSYTFYWWMFNIVKEKKTYAHFDWKLDSDI